MHSYKDLRTCLQNQILLPLAEIADTHALSFWEISQKHMEFTAEGNEEVEKKALAEILRQKAAALDAAFQVAVVGEFSSGKSTLINALLQIEPPILKTAHLANTASQTYLSYGQTSALQVNFRPELSLEPIYKTTNDLAAEIAHYTSNDAQRLVDGEEESLVDKVESVEVWCDSPFLKSLELTIIDTPGLGSVFEDHKTVTFGVIRKVDAIIFVVRAERAASKPEVTFVQMIREHLDKLFFVLTKKDRYEPEEIADVLESIHQTMDIKANVTVEHLYAVSAKCASEGFWQESGFPEFVPALKDFLQRSGGLTRLAAPIRFAMIAIEHSDKLLKMQIKTQHQQRDQLIVEYKRLETLAEEISRQQKTLVNHVDQKLEQISFEAKQGIDILPGLLKKAVEEAVDDLNADEVKTADLYINAAIKTTITRWLDGKKKNFGSEIRALNQHLKDEMLAMLGQLDFDESQLSLIRSIEIDIANPVAIGKLGHDLGDKILKRMVSIGITDTIASRVVDIGRNLWNTGKNMVAGLLGLFRKKPAEPSRSKIHAIHEDIKNALLEPLGDQSTSYNGIVFGFSQNGRRHAGIEQTITEFFGEWGQQLRVDIAKTIANNVQNRLDQLHEQIKRDVDPTNAQIDATLAQLTHDLEVLQFIQNKLRILQTDYDDACRQEPISNTA